jgi:putative inorganic carbon (hco3(-)) transporter
MKNKEKILTLFLSIYLITGSLLPNEIQVFQFNIPLMDTMFLIILIAFAAFLFDREYWKTMKFSILNSITNKFDVSLLVLLFIMGASTIYSIEKVLAIRETIRFASYLVIYFIIKYFIRKEESIKFIMNSIIINLFIVCIFGVFQYITNFQLKAEYINNYDYIKRIPSTLENPNALAGYLILFLFPLIMLSIKYFNNRKQEKFKFFIYTFLAVMSFVGIVLSGSRNGYVGIFVGIVILSCLYSFKIILAYGVIGAISVINPHIAQRILDLFDMTKNSARLNLWQLGSYIIKDHPLLGVGNGNYVVHYDIYSEKYPSLRYGDYKRFSSHNSYIKIESELGIAGGLTFGLMILFLIKETLKFINNVTSDYWKVFYIGFLASIVAFFTMNIFDNLLFAPKIALYFWVLIAIMESYKHNVLDINN